MILDIERPGRRDAFVDLGGDSVAAMEFSAMLDMQFGVSMSLDRLAECPTIAAVVADLQAAGGQRRQPVVNLRTDGVGPVCLTVPGIGGHAWKFLALAGALAGPCDVLGLSLMDLREGPAGQYRSRIRDAALAALRSASVAGRPIVVAGYSFGGMVAADLVCSLNERGVAVDRLILLDPDPMHSAVPTWNPSDIRRGPKMAMFAPGSAAARQLNADINEMSGLLQRSYLDGTVRLPAQTPVAWLQTEEVAAKNPSAATLFGTPVEQLEKTVIDLYHLGIIEIPGVDRVAAWFDRQLPGRPLDLS